MYRPYLVLTLVVLLLAVSLASGNQEQSLTILYTSDLAARYQPVDLDSRYNAGWARLGALIESIRLEESPVLLLDPGDYLDEKQLMCQEEGAEPVVQMLNQMRYDSVGIGMDELNWGSEGALERLGHASFPIVCANLVFADTQELLFWPYWVVQHAETRVAIMGVLSTSAERELIRLHMQDLKVLPPAKALRPHVEKVRSIVDVIIVLSYMDDDANRELARSLPDIHVILGGFSHERPLDPIVEGKTIIAHAGSGPNQLGRLDIQLSGDKIQDWEHHILTVASDTIPEPNLAKMADEAKIAEQVLRAEVLGQLTTPLTRQKGKESDIGNWVTDAMRIAVGADIAFENSGGIRRDLPEGLITQGDLFDLNYYNTIVTFKLTGAQVRQVLEQNSRGEGDLLQVSGLSYIYEPAAPEGERVQKVKVAGHSLDPKATYVAATNHFVAALAERFFGFELPAYQDTQISLYESQIEALRRNANISIDPKKRIQALTNHSSK